VVALLRRLQSTQPTAGTELDAVLVARAKLDPLAFEPLYLRYLDEIARFCYARLRDEERARDATQQIFARALRALPGYEEQGQFRGWLYAIARSVLANDLRAYRPHATLEAAAELLDPAASPEDAALAAGEQRALLAAIASLPDDQRHAIELRMAGLTGIEIAETMGRTHDSVRMLQRRAIDRLRHELLAAVGVTEDRHGA
jgi:RNA polymerase sigma-70 factor (ECF subfamily)